MVKGLDFKQDVYQGRFWYNDDTWIDMMCTKQTTRDKNEKPQINLPTEKIIEKINSTNHFNYDAFFYPR